MLHFFAPYQCWKRNHHNYAFRFFHWRNETFSSEVMFYVVYYLKKSLNGDGNDLFSVRSLFCKLANCYIFFKENDDSIYSKLQFFFSSKFFITFSKKPHKKISPTFSGKTFFSFLPELISKNTRQLNLVAQTRR